MEHLAEELADGIICIDLIAMDENIDLDAAVADKFNRTSINNGLRTRLGRASPPAPHVFLDCDGVLADFDRHGEDVFGDTPRQAEWRMGSSAFWAALEARGDFYRTMPLMPDAMRLYEGVKHLKPTILTGCPKGDWAEAQKVAWAAEHFPGVPIITCRSADKAAHAVAGDVLIDDRNQHRHHWIGMGGVFITHTDAETSLGALWAHYPQLAIKPLFSQPEIDRLSDALKAHALRSAG